MCLLQGGHADPVRFHPPLNVGKNMPGLRQFFYI